MGHIIQDIVHVMACVRLEHDRKDRRVSGHNKGVIGPLFDSFQVSP